ncbi:methylated-DNA--[protein]-cysteine S-methyltransferase [Allobranchiibius sp. CTAmp26]|uniref:methylated-DNA--[protein]-cysteine S-methyltransferase n=1 Tax=Allobranchiibius sp. CTAmp26 TaxID=2815214 RepID=UPI001AA0F64D|nr:methylated-DNA--[protein]-cysteine S-methyltransferase [Allobranchiibius sp. CTAmp26]MBO1753689.1 methylated-DNA--[protein]-cysteine S-methyltransferase [Allobranchiibius sp. CTAmp26]
MNQTSHFQMTGTPIGDLTLVRRGPALSALYMQKHRHQPEESTFGPREESATGVLADAVAQLREYFRGERRTFDLPLDPVGTDFQQRVWAQLRAIPYGCTRSYGDLARALGSVGASRAVGLANGRNPISIVVPCHRVIGANGAMTGFGGGIERKVWLLQHERETLGEQDLGRGEAQQMLHLPR